MLPTELHQQIRRLEIRTRRLVNENLVGKYHSTFKGQGVEFDEVRAYQPGDEIRTIDWNVSARMGAPYVKRFSEERQLNVILAVDASASGSFGTSRRTKRELSAEVGAALTFSAISNQDHVGLLLFTDRVEHHIPPKRGRKHALRIIRDILAFQPVGRTTSLICALDYLNHTLKRRAVIFLISDFLLPYDNPEDLRPYQKALKITNQHHDLIAVSISDPLEFKLPDIGILTLEDAENSRITHCDTSDPLWRKNYELHVKHCRRQRDITLGQAKIDRIDLTTGTDFIAPLLAFFHNRTLRRGS